MYLPVNIEIYNDSKTRESVNHHFTMEDLLCKQERKDLIQQFKPIEYLFHLLDHFYLYDENNVLILNLFINVLQDITVVIKNKTYGDVKYQINVYNNKREIDPKIYGTKRESVITGVEKEIYKQLKQLTRQPELKPFFKKYKWSESWDENEKSKARIAKFVNRSKTVE